MKTDFECRYSVYWKIFLKFVLNFDSLYRCYPLRRKSGKVNLECKVKLKSTLIWKNKKHYFSFSLPKQFLSVITVKQKSENSDYSIRLKDDSLWKNILQTIESDLKKSDSTIEEVHTLLFKLLFFLNFCTPFTTKAMSIQNRHFYGKNRWFSNFWAKCITIND